MSNIPFTPTPSWASTWPGITPSGTSGLTSGLASLPGSSGGILARGLPSVASVTPLAESTATRAIPGLFSGGGLASQVPTGLGQEALTAANALRPAAGSLAEQAVTGSGLNAARLAGAAGTASLPGVLGAAGLKGGLARAAVPMATGYAANAIFGKGDEGFGTQAGRGFLAGAGWGVPAAGAVAAIPGVNLVGVPLIAAAAGITGMIGAALDLLDAGKWFGGGGKDDTPAVDPDAVLTNILQTAQLDADTTAQIMDAYSINMQMAATIEDKTQRAATEAQALQTAGQMALQALQSRDQASTSASNTLALQSQAQSIFAPLANDITESSRLYADAMARIAPTLPDSYRGIADASVARELSSSQKLAAAYQAQAQVAPYIQQLTQYQQDQNSYAAQMFQQAMAQQAAGGGTTLGPSAQDVIAQLQPTG